MTLCDVCGIEDPAFVAWKAEGQVRAPRWRSLDVGGAGVSSTRRACKRVMQTDDSLLGFRRPTRLDKPPTDGEGG